MQKFVYLVVAGAAGTLARYGLAGLVHRIDGAWFPWGTLTVNLLGCLLAGLGWSLFEDRLAMPAQLRTIVLVGFMGAFTTFSAYILETGQLLRSSQWLAAAANLLLQNILGLVALFGGAALGRMF